MDWNRNTFLNIPVGYGKSQVRNDVLAGLTLWVMIVPQGMAYAVLAGLPPIMGLYASFLPLVIYALIGRSTTFAIGPVALASMLVFSGVSVMAEPMSSTYVSLVLTLTLMVGVLQVLLGVMNAAAFIKFISPNVISGFTAAVAVTIALSQLGALLGIEGSNASRLVPLIRDTVGKVSAIHGPTLVMGAASLAILMASRYFKVRAPVSLLVVVLSIVLVAGFRLDEIGVRVVGDVPQGLPGLSLSSLALDDLQVLLPTALTIALMAMVETLAITRAFGAADGRPLRLNRELQAIGLANIVGAFVSSYTVTGSFSRSAVSARAGAVSQFAMFVTAGGVLVTLLWFTSVFYFLPYAVLAAIIVVSVTGLINTRPFREAWKVKPEDGGAWAVTFAATLLLGIQWGLLAGVSFSLLLLLRHVAKPHIVEIGWEDTTQSYRDLQRYPRARKEPGLILIRVDTRIHFSNIEVLTSMVHQRVQDREPGTDGKLQVVLEMSGVNDMDTAGMEGMERLLETYEEQNHIQLWLVGVKGPVRDVLARAGWRQTHTAAITYSTLDQLLAEERLDGGPKRISTEQKPWDYMI